MKITCPKCNAQIPLEDVNVSTDIALCRNCGKTFSFSELNEDEGATAVDILQPPRGAWTHSQGTEFEVGATTRSAAAFFLVPFTLVWSGGSIGGIYGTQIAHGRFDLVQSLFGLPFLLGSVVLLSLTLMSVFGKLVVRASGDAGAVFVGVGPVGWTKRFRWSEIEKVRLSKTQWQQNGRTLPLLELVRPQPIRFGSQLSEARRNFMLTVLRRHMTAR